MEVSNAQAQQEEEQRKSAPFGGSAARSEAAD